MYIKLAKHISKILILIILFSVIKNFCFKNEILVNALNIKKQEMLDILDNKVPCLIKPSKGVITSNFGPRNGIKHHGVDIASNMGTPIKASYKGVVYKVDYHNIYGKRIIINHGNGIETLYAHCNNILVKEGQNVIGGQHIANIGNTGKSTGPHIHFELRVNGKAINPMNYMK